MSDAQQRTRVVVRGRVQGVYFRGATLEEAERVGVSGWVRNRGDGCVEAVFEGPATAVDALVRFCGEGPRWARVEEVERFEEPLEGLDGFEIRA